MEKWVDITISIKKWLALGFLTPNVVGGEKEIQLYSP